MNVKSVQNGAVREEATTPATKTIMFGEQRPSVSREGYRRLFTPVRNVIGEALQSAGNPRAILRMVSGHC
jgi:hypothetical protein